MLCVDSGLASERTNTWPVNESTTAQ